MGALHLRLVKANYWQEPEPKLRHKRVIREPKQRRQAKLTPLMVEFVADLWCIAGDGKHFMRADLNKLVDQKVFTEKGLTDRLHRLIYSFSILDKHNDPWHYRYTFKRENIPQGVWDEIANRKNRSQFNRFFAIDPLVPVPEIMDVIDLAMRYLTGEQKQAVAQEFASKVSSKEKK